YVWRKPRLHSTSLLVLLPAAMTPRRARHIPANGTSPNAVNLGGYATDGRVARSATAGLGLDTQSLSEVQVEQERERIRQIEADCARLARRVRQTPQAREGRRLYFAALAELEITRMRLERIKGTVRLQMF